MTTVAFHNGIMASDGQSCTYDDEGRMIVVEERIQKIYNIHGRLYGFSGELPSIMEFIKHMEDKTEITKDYSANMSVLEWDGKTLYTWRVLFKPWYIFHPKKSCFWYGRVEIGDKDTFASIGSGYSFARDAHNKGNSLEVCIMIRAQIVMFGWFHWRRSRKNSLKSSSRGIGWRCNMGGKLQAQTNQWIGILTVRIAPLHLIVILQPSLRKGQAQRRSSE